MRLVFVASRWDEDDPQSDHGSGALTAARCGAAVKIDKSGPEQRPYD
jgi:hypothetical protein